METTSNTQEQTLYLSCAETAKLLRAALKAAFPKTKFSVRSHTYSGGASVDVGWTDGPTVKQVQHVTSQYEGATFDGSIDLKTYHTSTLNGRTVHHGADFIFENRLFTATFLQPIAERVSARYGHPTPPLEWSRWSGAYVEQNYTQTVNGLYTLADYIRWEAHETTALEATTEEATR